MSRQKGLPRLGRRSGVRRQRSGGSTSARVRRRTGTPSEPHSIRRYSPYPRARRVMTMPGIPVLQIWVGFLAATLLGAASTMIIAGLAARCREVFGARAPTSASVAAIGLVALGIGIGVPQRFAVWLCDLAWRRLIHRGQTSEIAVAFFGPSSADQPLQWAVLSVVSLAAGVATALVPVHLRLTGSFYGWLHVHFVWSDVPLVALHLFLVSLTGVVPLATLGLAVACAHHLICRCGAWAPAATGWAVMGAAFGGLISGWMASHTSNSDLTLLAASLPVLTLALIAAASASSLGFASARPCSRIGHGAENERWSLPIVSDDKAMLLRTTVISLGAVAGIVGGVWAGCTSWMTGQSSAPTWHLLAVLALGLLIGCRIHRDALRTDRVFGVACASAGLLIALSTLRASGESALGWLGAVRFASLASLGVAVAYGLHARLQCVASRSSVAASTLACVLLAAGLGIGVATQVADSRFGPRAALWIAGLCLAALGGTPIFRDLPIRRRQGRSACGLGL